MPMSSSPLPPPPPQDAGECGADLGGISGAIRAFYCLVCREYSHAAAIATAANSGAAYRNR